MKTSYLVLIVILALICHALLAGCATGYYDCRRARHDRDYCLKVTGGP